MSKVQEGCQYNKKLTEENLEKANTAVKRGISKPRAATGFGVPRQTLQFRLK